ncbi:MAG: hypothetical protein QOI45_811, partial [Thermoleophilaceae bacterium]|nr:hypothetical protein [Thermoleophilaceae bacterium]
MAIAHSDSPGWTTWKRAMPWGGAEASTLRTSSVGVATLSGGDSTAGGAGAGGVGGVWLRRWWSLRSFAGAFLSTRAAPSLLSSGAGGGAWSGGWGGVLAAGGGWAGGAGATGG